MDDKTIYKYLGRINEVICYLYKIYNWKWGIDKDNFPYIKQVGKYAEEIYYSLKYESNNSNVNKIISEYDTDGWKDAPYDVFVFAYYPEVSASLRMLKQYIQPILNIKEILLKEKANSVNIVSLPKEFDTPEVKKSFEKMIDYGFVSIDGGGYKWIASASLFGYFVDISSRKLGIRPSNENKPWRKYKPIFTNYEKIIATAKQAVNDYDNKDLSKPQGYEIILEVWGKNPT